MDPEIRTFFIHALQAADDIVRYTRRLEFDDYENDDMLQAAVERKLEIIGEALNRVRRRSPDVLSGIYNHDRIIGLRNVLAHGYDIVDNRLIWSVVRLHLPRFRREIQHTIQSQ